ncbi:hypothetical protein Vadar_002723 [Vaccinium darrowii]|uniref:Uncharacterized protein n=1 Tax=Vaccinium darrowii TaxID=229202 RepID=A0ACB7Y5V7_9ERIC|nr:hypothetical protein Vadar_002723 [Vaccinium darrowii]
MSDNAEDTLTGNAPAPEDPKPEDPKPPAMAEIDEQPPQTLPSQPEVAKISERMSTLSFSIWPPTQRTRDAVLKRLVETLSTPSSVLSKRYGTMPQNDAADAARRIEDEAFAAAAAVASADADEDGIEVLQVYSKEISKRMLDAVKSRSVTGSVQDGVGVSQSADVAAASGEEISAVESEA